MEDLVAIAAEGHRLNIPDDGRIAQVAVSAQAPDLETWRLMSSAYAATRQSGVPSGAPGSTLHRILSKV